MGNVFQSLSHAFPSISCLLKAIYLKMEQSGSSVLLDVEDRFHMDRRGREAGSMGVIFPLSNLQGVED